MTDLVLALNAGSSNLKCALFDADAASAPIGRRQLDAEGEDAVSGAALELIAWAEGARPGGRVVAVGHRVVHGGSAFPGPALVTAATLAAMEQLAPLAPLHQPQSLAAIRRIAAERPELDQVACFDTAFHRTQEPLATWLALPRALRDKGMRRYGFHGLSYDYLSARLTELDPSLARGRVILAHLGSGASLCALKGRRSIDTTMGFSALDGLVMGTRPGSLDPGALLYLLKHEGLSADELEDLLYRRSGLLGVSGLSADMRTLLQSKEPEAQEAVDLFVWRIAREAGALASAMGGIDGVVFAGGIGEHSPEIRARIADRLAWLGLELDSQANQGGGEARISTSQSRMTAWVIPTDEEQVICRQTLAVSNARETSQLSAARPESPS